MKFAIVGVGGYIAKKHLSAIYTLGHEVVSAYDPHDSVGLMDSFDKNVEFYSNHLQFSADGLKDADWLVVCSPNDTHCDWVIRGLHSGLNVICEKPLVLKTTDIAKIREAERTTKNQVYTIQQLRHHPMVPEIQNLIAADEEKTLVDVVYSTPRGKWYDHSWKGDPMKSGGILFNIGIHLFDLMLLLNGGPKKIGIDIDFMDDKNAMGSFSFPKFVVNWNLSIEKDKTPKRCVVVNGREFELVGFEELHTLSYQSILAGNGCSINTVAASISLVEVLYDQYRKKLEKDYDRPEE